MVALSLKVQESNTSEAQGAEHHNDYNCLAAAGVGDDRGRSDRQDDWHHLHRSSQRGQILEERAGYTWRSGCTPFGPRSFERGNQYFLVTFKLTQERVRDFHALTAIWTERRRGKCLQRYSASAMATLERPGFAHDRDFACDLPVQLDGRGGCIDVPARLEIDRPAGPKRDPSARSADDRCSGLDENYPAQQ